MCCNEADYDNCKAVFKDNERVTVMEMSINDAWFRDTGATFLVNGKGDKAATDWHFNACLLYTSLFRVRYRDGCNDTDTRKGPGHRAIPYRKRTFVRHYFPRLFHVEHLVI